jgi:hypothetical protein
MATRYWRSSQGIRRSRDVSCSAHVSMNWHRLSERCPHTTVRDLGFLSRWCTRRRKNRRGIAFSNTLKTAPGRSRSLHHFHAQRRNGSLLRLNQHVLCRINVQRIPWRCQLRERIVTWEPQRPQRQGTLPYRGPASPAGSGRNVRVESVLSNLKHRHWQDPERVRFI